MEEKKLLIDIREKPSTGKWFILSFQHVFAMFGSTVLVPMLTGLPINTALLCSGIGTFIYILCTKRAARSISQFLRLHFRNYCGIGSQRQ